MAFSADGSTNIMYAFA